MDNTLMTAIYPHPPIMIPEVGKGELPKVEKTINAAKKLSSRIVEANPETIIIVTPHSYLNHRFFNVYVDDVLTGDFSNFGAPEAKVSFENDIEFIHNLAAQSKDIFGGLSQIPPGTPLDHGSAVPLYYLAHAGYKGKIVVINYTVHGAEEHIMFGSLITKTANLLERKTVFVASGDMSHKLLETAPAGYHPDAHYFDETIAEGISNGKYESIINMSPVLRKKAGECAFNSLMVAMGVVNKQPQHNEVIDYEAPFGVGYLVATL
jgi:AmmeMemoRadiSam system protein B